MHIYPRESRGLKRFPIARNCCECLHPHLWKQGKRTGIQGQLDMCNKVLSQYTKQGEKKGEGKWEKMRGGEKKGEGKRKKKNRHSFSDPVVDEKLAM